MDKQPLISGSIYAVVLLFLGPLSNAVGHQFLKSTVNDSPLFATQTQRATNQKQSIITAQYLGQGRDSMSFPCLDNKTSMILKLLHQIRNMDDNTFRKFVKNAIRLFTQQGTVRYTDTKDIENGFRQLREHPKAYRSFTYFTIGNYTWRLTPTICWFPGCFLLFIFVVFLLTVGFHCFPTEKICVNVFPLP